MKPFVNLSTATIWVVGRSSATAQLINQLSPFAHSLAFQKVPCVNTLIQVMKPESPDHQQVIIVPTDKLDYADLDVLQTLTVDRPTVRIAVCFSTAHLGMLSYAWALDFAVYFTTDDAASECNQLITRLMNSPQNDLLYSTVFREWLRRYGILFEHDQLPFPPHGDS